VLKEGFAALRTPVVASNPQNTPADGVFLIGSRVRAQRGLRTPVVASNPPNTPADGVLLIGSRVRAYKEDR